MLPPPMGAAVGVRHPFELTGLLGTDRRKAVLSQVLLLSGFECLICQPATGVTVSTMNRTLTRMFV